MRRGVRSGSPTGLLGHRDEAATSPYTSPRIFPLTVVKTPRDRIIAFSVIAAVATLVGIGWLYRSSKFSAAQNWPATPSTNLHVVTLSAVALAGRAGREIVDIRASGGIPGDADAAGKEPVTIADTASHNILMELERPELPVISEEGVANEALPYIHDAKTIVTYVDPLDATQEYTEQLTEYVSVAVCVTRCGEPVASVIHFPFSGTTYVALPLSTKRSQFRYPTLADALQDVRTVRPTYFVLPQSSSCSCMADRGRAQNDAAKGVRARGAEPPALDGKLRIIVTRSHFKNETRSSQTGLQSLKSVVELLQRQYPDAVVTRAGGAGYKLMAVYDGAAELYIHDGPIRMWDVCAGVQILRTAGMHVSDWTGSKHNFCVPADALAYASVPINSRDGVRATGATYDKRSFAVSGIVAARSPALHAYVLELIQQP